MLGSISPSQGRGWALGSSAARTGIPVAFQHHPSVSHLSPASCCWSHSPSGCSRLVHAGSTWSLCYPVVMLVLLSRKAAFHEHTWFARSTVLPEQGQKTNPPCWEELSRRQEPLMSAEAMQIRYTPLDQEIKCWLGSSSKEIPSHHRVSQDQMSLMLRFCRPRGKSPF